MKTVWHDLRTKPKPYNYVLVKTTSTLRQYRLCYILDDGVWKDASVASYFYPNKIKKKYGIHGDFTVKKWAYINDIK